MQSDYVTFGPFLEPQDRLAKPSSLAFMLDHFAHRESGIVILQPSNSIVACSEVRKFFLSFPLHPTNSEPVTGGWVQMLSLLPGFPTEHRLCYTETPARSCWLRSEDCSISNRNPLYTNTDCDDILKNPGSVGVRQLIYTERTSITGFLHRKYIQITATVNSIQRT